MTSMSETRSSILSESKKKGILAGLSTAAAITVGVAIAPVAGVIAAVPAAYLGWKWWNHRAKNGIRF